jgi:hypothetical protein
MDRLGIYLNDHLALGVAGRELVRRAARQNEGTELGAFLGRLAREVAEDLETLRTIVERLEFPVSRIKGPLALVGERIGRLKPNGQLRGYSPLSRYIELEGLALGIEGKALLWANLRDLAGVGDRLEGIDLDALIERARRQRDELEGHRLEAARLAFSRR